MILGVVALMMTSGALRKVPVTMRQAMSIARPNNVSMRLDRGVKHGLGTPGVPEEVADRVAWILAHFDSGGIYCYG